MRGTIAKRLRREARQEAERYVARTNSSTWYGVDPIRTLTGLICRMKKRRLKKYMRSHIDSPNRQIMLSRTEAVTRTKKIVWSFFSTSPLRVTGTKVSVHRRRNERVFSKV